MRAPITSGAVVQESKITLPGIGKLVLTPKSVEEHEACLTVSGGDQSSDWCGVTVEDGRLFYLVTLALSKDARFPYGGDIPVVAPLQRGITIAIAHVEYATGTTHADHIFRPTIHTVAPGYD